MPAEARRVEDVRRIAVLRANSIGDYIFAIPALEALKAAYPQAELVLLGAPWHHRWLTGRPGPVDRVVTAPPLHGIRDPEPGEDAPAREEFLAWARRERFDLALQMHGGGRNSNSVANGLGARVTAGLRTEDAEPLDRWIRYVYLQPEVFRYLEVAALVGAEPVSVTPSLEVADADVAEARRVAGQPRRPRAALHPGANDPRRRWPAERFAAVADALTADGCEVVLTGASGEREIVERVLAAAPGRARSLAGELSLGGLAGLYAECDVVVSNDTGPLHLAAAVGAPTVGVYWLGNFVNGATPLRSRHRPLVSWTVRCPVCGAERVGPAHPARRQGEGACGHRVSFVVDVPVAEVLDAARDLLAGSLTAAGSGRRATALARGSAR